MCVWWGWWWGGGGGCMAGECRQTLRCGGGAAEELAPRDFCQGCRTGAHHWVFTVWIALNHWLSFKVEAHTSKLGPALSAASLPPPGCRSLARWQASASAGAPQQSSAASCFLIAWGHGAPPLLAHRACQGRKSFVKRLLLATLSRGMRSPASPARRPSRVVLTPSCTPEATFARLGGSGRAPVSGIA